MHTRKTSLNRGQKFDELNQIADKIAAAEAPWKQAWQDIYELSAPGVELERALQQAVSKLNAVIEPLIDDIARITGNSASTLRQAYRGDDSLSVMFSGSQSLPPSAFIRNVAKYESFNTDYWAKCERDDAREAARASIDLDAPLLTPAEAAKAILNGQVPHVSEMDAKAPYHNSLSNLEKALKEAGVLRQYDKQFQERVSATSHFAFVVDSCNSDGEISRVFHFWPKGLAANHKVVEPYSPEADIVQPASRPISG